MVRMQPFVMRARAVDGDEGASAAGLSYGGRAALAEVPACGAAIGRGSGGRDLALLALLEERGIGEMS